ncbi:MAG TPA: hypothetical protein VGB79_00960 [Allosphingosinicella sp.]|jgi:hypothetical protein
MDAAGAQRRSPLRRWLRRLGHAAVAAGLAGILGFLVYFASNVAAGPPISFGDGLRLFVQVMPAALFAPVVLTLPILALGLVVEKSWRGWPPIALWALAGALIGLVASLILSRNGATHLPAAAFGALAMLVFGWLEREEALARG